MARLSRTLGVFGGFVAVVGAAFYPIYFRPLLLPDEYKREQSINRAGIVQENIQPPAYVITAEECKFCAEEKGRGEEKLYALTSSLCVMKSAIPRGVVPKLRLYCWVSSHSQMMPADLMLAHVQWTMASDMAISDKTAALKTLFPSDQFPPKG
ncbi:hypothetical protein ASZ78_001040 [Callipepla squamata]|uniref:Small integral membrane protein 20 n=1 Tax=Callipepla squamata TaxID=9009 RepID=A0A226N6J5_CALSU|nr:hypothetical protein ASZ78_001040 [Callipepla squamata]